MSIYGGDSSVGSWNSSNDDEGQERFLMHGRSALLLQKNARDGMSVHGFLPSGRPAASRARQGRRQKVSDPFDRPIDERFESRYLLETVSRIKELEDDPPPLPPKPAKLTQVVLGEVMTKRERKKFGALTRKTHPFIGKRLMENHAMRNKYQRAIANFDAGREDDDSDADHSDDDEADDDGTGSPGEKASRRDDDPLGFSRMAEADDDVLRDTMALDDASNMLFSRTSATRGLDRNRNEYNQTSEYAELLHEANKREEAEERAAVVETRRRRQLLGEEVSSVSVVPDFATVATESLENIKNPMVLTDAEKKRWYKERVREQKLMHMLMQKHEDEVYMPAVEACLLKNGRRRSELR